MKSEQHLDDLLGRHAILEGCRGDILAAFEMLRECYRSSGKALICGNGGSAADCEHWAGEMLKGFVSCRSIDPSRCALPPSLANKLQGALPMIPLTGFLSLSSAFANDVDPQLVFAQLVFALARQGDVVIGISTSGKSPSVVHAMDSAVAMGARTLALTGESGGTLGEKCEVCIRVPAKKTFLVQELHLPIYHTLSLMLEDEFFAG